MKNNRLALILSAVALALSAHAAIHSFQSRRELLELVDKHRDSQEAVDAVIVPRLNQAEANIKTIGANVHKIADRLRKMPKSGE